MCCTVLYMYASAAMAGGGDNCAGFVVYLQAMYCSGHREPQMVDVVYKRCEFPGGCEKVSW